MKRAAALVAILIMAIASTANADTVRGVATVTDNGNTFVNTGWLTVDGYDWGIDSGPYNTIVQITEWAGVPPENGDPFPMDVFCLEYDQDIESEWTYNIVTLADATVAGQVLGATKANLIRNLWLQHATDGVTEYVLASSGTGAANPL